MQRTYRFGRAFQIASLLAALTALASGQEAGTKGAVLKRLEQDYITTQTTDDLTDIATPGSILTMKKDDLVTVAITSGSVCPNVYRNGKITHNLLAKVTCGSANIAFKRKVFLSGMKLWVTKIDVKDTGVVFDLYTDAYAGERYRGTLLFPIAKGATPNPEQLAKEVAEVFSAAPPPPPAVAQPDAGQALPATPAAPQEQALPPIDAPPPPPAEAKRISIGLTTQQVIASFGQPEKSGKLPAKEIYYYKDLKVIFVNDKVADVE